ncbi:unnamed protein product [Discula destructiva]
MDRTILAARLAAAAHPQHQHHNVAADWQDIDDLSDDDGNRSAIMVRISTAVHVTGDNNIMHVTADNAATGRFLAEAVTRVLRGGVPMIDEEGQPRPLRVEIEAGIKVYGEGNVLGGEEVVSRALGKRKRAPEEEQEEDEAAARGQSLRVRLRRSTSV